MQAVPVKFSLLRERNDEIGLTFDLILFIRINRRNSPLCRYVKWLILDLGDKKNVNSYLLEYFFHKFIRI